MQQSAESAHGIVLLGSEHLQLCVVGDETREREGGGNLHLANLVGELDDDGKNTLVRLGGERVDLEKVDQAEAEEDVSEPCGCGCAAPLTSSSPPDGQGQTAPWRDLAALPWAGGRTALRG